MACPVSVATPLKLGGYMFQTQNLHFPFLFSTMGIIFSKAWESYQQKIKNEESAKKVADMSFLSWLGKFITGQESRSATYRKEARLREVLAMDDWQMANYIWEYLCIEEYVDELVDYPGGVPKLQFARNGKKVYLEAGFRPKQL